MEICSVIIKYILIRPNTANGNVLSDSSPSVGPAADPGAQAVSLQVTSSHPPGGRLPLLSARPAVTTVAFT